MKVSTAAVLPNEAVLQREQLMPHDKCSHDTVKARVHVMRVMCSLRGIPCSDINICSKPVFGLLIGLCIYIKLLLRGYGPTMLSLGCKTK